MPPPRSTRSSPSLPQSSRTTRQSVRQRPEPLSETEIPATKSRLKRQAATPVPDTHDIEDDALASTRVSPQGNAGLKKNGLAKIDEELAGASIDSAQAAENDGIRSNSVVSVTSGITILQIEDLRGKADQLLKLLPRLASSSLNIVTTIRSELNSVAIFAEMPKELSSPTSNLYAMFGVFAETFELYTNMSSHWTSPSHVLRALVPDQVSDEGFESLETSLTYILNLANMANLLIEIVSEAQHGETMTVLQTVENVFPQPFMSSLRRTSQALGSGQSQLVAETLLAVVAIRTHLVIAMLRSKETEARDPDVVLQQVLLKPWDVSNFQYIERRDAEAFQQETIKRANEIRDCHKQDLESLAGDDLIDFDQLDQKFPWTTFVHDVANWVGSRAREINMQTKDYGGVTELATDFQEQITHRSSNIAVDNAEPQQHFDSSSLPKDKQRALLLQVKRSFGKRMTLREATSKSAKTLFPQPSSSRVLQSSAPVAIEEMPDESRETPAVQEATVEVKQTSLMDRQANASKVAFESQEVVENVLGQASAVINSSQDNDFQRDTRSTDVAVRRAEAAKMQTGSRKRLAEPPSAQLVQSPEKRLRRLEDEDEDFTPNPTALEAEEPESRSPDHGAKLYRNMSQITKERNEFKQEKAQNLRLNKARRYGMRLAWSDVEDKALIHYIGQYGCKWSRIKEQDGDDAAILEERGQVDLKDRARNMKYEFLRKHIDLPKNFADIPLPKSQLERLERAGVIDPLQLLRRSGPEAMSN